MKEVWVTGMGLFTAMGSHVEANLQSLLHERSGLRLPQFLSTIHKSFHIGEIPFSTEQLAEKAQFHNPLLSRTAILGILGVEECLQQIDKQWLKKADIAFINATSVGGMPEVEKIYDQLIDNELTDLSPSLQYIDALDFAESTQAIVEHFGIKGYCTTISTACSSSANAIQLGARLIASGQYDMVVCGGVDALSKFALNGFLSLKNVSEHPAKAFDENRQGLNLGEGSAYLLLESTESLNNRKSKPLARILGYGNTNEAHHATAPSPDGTGAFRTMQAALQHAQLEPTAIDYINAHGTATIGNDISELMAIKTLFGDTPPAFSSTKAFTGHTLAAAGAVEAVFSILSMLHNFIPANLNLETPIQAASHIVPQTTTLYTPVNKVLSNSFAFGGNNVSLVFGKN